MGNGTRTGIVLRHMLGKLCYHERTVWGNSGEGSEERRRRESPSLPTEDPNGKQNTGKTEIARPFIVLVLFS